MLRHVFGDGGETTEVAASELLDVVNAGPARRSSFRGGIISSHRQMSIARKQAGLLLTPTNAAAGEMGRPEAVGRVVAPSLGDWASRARPICTPTICTPTIYTSDVYFALPAAVQKP
ncbi:hypothetical protein LFT44_10280 [Arthrobacter sp. FW306-05-C]|uniref:hypothetical protein n=1 Tax=Arthrobacter sp. FW306-05-C TaxID=2879620 RepID=UPI001F2C5414|nr:hypothetical protein [Arthrobacter sp. FW306-05-C]UKA68736.1 hypothetical protein LFT44_10280 [Arthrobacter sp. FW306-05-C]